MASLNATKFFEGALYPSLDVNLSIISDDDDEFDGVITLEVSDNVTQFVLNATSIVFANGNQKPRFHRHQAQTITNFITWVSFYTCPIIVVVGCLSNLLAYLIFTKTSLRKVPSVPYLAAMAVVDSGALLTEFIQNGITMHGIHIINWSGVCQYTAYFSYIFIFLCIWYPVALCVEKFISVYFPWKKAALCTTFRAKIVIITMAVMTGTCYYYVIYMAGPVYAGNIVICHVWEFFRRDFFKLMMLDCIFTFVFPSIVLIVFMILICSRGCEYYRISTTVDVSNRVGSTRNSSIRAPVRVTNVIFPVILVILALKLPTGFLRLYRVLKAMPPNNLQDLQNIFLYVGRFEWVIKLYVYLLFSPSFRRRTKSFMCSLRSKLKGRCSQDSIEDEEVEALPISPRVEQPERSDRGGNKRAFHMASDV